MRRLIGWSMLFVMLAGLVILPWMMLDDSPAIEPPAEFRRNDLSWIKSLFHKHDPRRQTSGVVQTIRLDESELNRLLNYAVELPRVGGIAADLTPGLATLTATLSVPANPFGNYLNVTAEVADAPDGIRIESLQLGSLPVPGILADWTARRVHARLRRDVAYATLADAFSQVHFEENQAALDYRWNDNLLTQVERKGADLLVAKDDQARMLAYTEQLNRLLAPYRRGSTVPLVRIVAPLFAHAAQAGELEAPEENRAALTALAAYLSGISLPKLLEGDSRSIRRAPRVLLSLHGRRDLAEHFVISAALTVNGGTRFANAIGLIKEEDDADGGSGFSFTDLAANRAGVRLGERAFGEDAARIQKRLAAVRQDADLLPDFRDLPEFMPQAEFDRRFGPVGSPRYRAVINLIDARLATHPLAQ